MVYTKWCMESMYNYCKGHGYDLPKDNQVYINPRTKYIYSCPKHGEYKQSWVQHKNGAKGCVNCKNNLKRTPYKYNVLCRQKGYDLPIEPYINNHTPIKHKCRNEHVYEQRPSDHLRGVGCPRCARVHRKTPQEYLQECKDRGLDLPIEPYINADTNIKHKCSEGHIYSQAPRDHLRGIGCRECANLAMKYVRRKTNEEYINECKQLGYDIPIEEYIDTNTKIKHKCSKCGNVYLQTPHSHLRGDSCPKCGIDKIKQKLRKTPIQYYDECIERGYDIPIEPYVNNRTKIKHKCNKCGKIYKQKPSDHLQGYGCPKCGESRGERFIRNYLDKHNIHYIPQKTFNDLKDKTYLSYDFYLPKQKVLIEYQGLQHFIAGGKGKFDKDYFPTQQYHDKLKHDYALNNGYTLLEPTYKLNTQEKVNNYLDKHLKL